ncbi:hypothetical protein QTI66_00720 [Variovorax sp. J22R133]|uniref:hypothetical protein n=1 Tax=Variovorax brevis TaxID=3053503 RepID=UPI002577D7A6|nr:hypothetical protein [Variovorax sp. J22R133]MDM0110647.1 hypothetical protein [Variovorax sp. J22R133]
MTFTSSHLIRSLGALALAAATLSMAQTAAAADSDRTYLSKPEIQVSLIGKGILSKNLQSGMLSHWEFRPDGTVEAVNRTGIGRATGTWSIRDDGQMCVKMMNRTGCRYWFRKGDALANADTNAPDAQTVAEVRFE